MVLIMEIITVFKFLYFKRNLFNNLHLKTNRNFIKSLEKNFVIDKEKICKIKCSF